MNAAFFGSLVLFAGSPGLAAWLAYRRRWKIAAACLGVLSVLIGGVLTAWAIAQWLFA
jgi:hypothetical protein